MEQIGYNFLLILGILFGLHFARPVIKPLIRAFRHLAARRTAAIVVSGLFPIVVRLALLPVFPAPQPGVHDEFAYLLQADTFAHGRLANPPHPMWQHMETFHVLQQPTYAAKYFPGQAAMLAIGQLLTGSPWAGVLLSCGLLCAAVCWMLQSVLPPAWALFGALFVAMRFCIFTYWMNSYWGGAVAALGGALVFGAVFRILRQYRLLDGALLGGGLILIAVTRPFEAVLVGLMALGTLAWFSYRSGRWAWMIPVTAAGICLLSFVAYQNSRITGSPTVFPYSVYERQYAIASMFLLQEPKPAPIYHHAIMERFYRDFDLKLTLALNAHLWDAFTAKLYVLFLFFIQDWTVAVALLAVPCLFGWKRARLPLLFLGIFLAAQMPVKVIVPHYVAPIMPVYVLLLILAIHRLRMWNPDRKPTGSILARLVVASVFVTFVVNCVRIPIVDLTGDKDFRAARANLQQSLSRRGEPQLVLVRYGPEHDYHSEWVYNLADVDRSPVVWARDMGEERNRELLAYFQGRSVWLLEPDVSTVPKPYNAASSH